MSIDLNPFNGIKNFFGGIGELFKSPQAKLKDMLKNSNIITKEQRSALDKCASDKDIGEKLEYWGVSKDIVQQACTKIGVPPQSVGLDNMTPSESSSAD